MTFDESTSAMTSTPAISAGQPIRRPSPGSEDADGPPVAIVFGASSGIGRATARSMACDGHRLVLGARGVDRLVAVADEFRELGAADVIVVPVDVNEPDEVDHLVAEALARHGRIDVVVHSAAVMAYGAVERMPAEVFLRTVDTSIHGTYNVLRAVLAVFDRQARGHLVIVTSLLASVTVPKMGAYVVGKWGQQALVRTAQQELRDRPGVSVSSVAPGSVDTPIFRVAATFTGHVGRPPPPVIRPERVAAAIRRTLRHPRRHRSVGLTNDVIVAGFRFLPFLYDRLVTPLFERAAQGDEATAPTTGNVFAPRPPPSAPDADTRPALEHRGDPTR